MSYIVRNDNFILTENNGVYPDVDNNVLHIGVYDTKQEANKAGAKWTLTLFEDNDLFTEDEKAALEQLAKTGSDSDFKKAMQANPYGEDGFYWFLEDTVDIIDVNNEGLIFDGSLEVSISDPNFDEKVDKILEHFKLK